MRWIIVLMGTSRRRHVVLTSGIAALASVIAVASGGASTHDQNAFPSKLVGTWTRNITDADWRKYGQAFPAGVWKYAVAKNGTVGVYYPRTSYVDFSTKFVVTGQRMTVDAIPLCSTKGRYRWSLRGRLLTIKEVGDPGCRPRAALFTGVWKKKT